jgi:membrane protein DedA with SNARE-associated domain
MVAEIIDLLAQLVVQIIDFLGYGGIFLLMLIESCGIPMPSEVIMPFSGFLVAAGAMNFWLVALLGTIGNLIGSLLAYWIGWRGGRPLVEKYGKYLLIFKHDLDVGDRWFSKRGELAVFFGRLLPIVRTYISFPAGIARMSLKKFAFYTFLGALPWCLLFTWLGVKMENNWDLIRQKLHTFDLAIGILIIAGIAWYVWRHIRNRKREAVGNASQDDSSGD